MNLQFKRKIVVIVMLLCFLIPLFGQNGLTSNPIVQNVIGAPLLELEQKWNYTTSGNYVSATPTLFDLYEDGTMDVIYGTSKDVICLDDQGNLNNSVVRGSLAVVDVDNDNKPNIVVGVSDSLRFFDRDGSYMRNTGTGYIMRAPSIVDFEGDGEWEFLTPSYLFYDGIYCINSNGSIRWSYTELIEPTLDRVYGTPTACDLNGDGVIEVLFGSWDGYLYCLNETGHYQWRSSTGGQIWSTPSIADVDDNGNYDIIIGSNSGMVYCFNYDGTTLWSQDLVHKIYTSAVIGDLDSDNSLEVYIGVNGESGVSTPALHRLDAATGAIAWHFNGSTGFYRSPAIADVDGDGVEEIVMVTDDGVIRVLTAAGSLDDNMIYTMANDAACSLVIADLDNDGYMDILVGDVDGVLYCLNVKYASANYALTRWHTLGGSMFRNGHPDADGDYIDNQKEDELGLTPTNVDTDNDQLDEGRELFLYHTDPLDDDTDDDNISDGDEVIYFGTNPLEPDSDFDGLSDRWEVDLGTDPWDTDTDGDLLTDGEEWNTIGSDPRLNDTDSDGLDDWEEYNLGADGYFTTIDNNDTDADGIIDGDEASYGTSPIDSDSDDDNILDGEEVIAGADGFVTDPLDDDSDDDGLLDGAEVNTHLTDPNDSDSDDDNILDGEEVIGGIDGFVTNPNDADTDSDGFDDDVEISEGTDPTDPDDYPVVETPTPTETPTTTPTEDGSLIGGFVSLGIVLFTALFIIASVERRKKYFK